MRALTGEQSNTSLVFDEQVVLKVFRRLAAGTNPELEMLRFLSERRCENIAELLGWFEHRGERIDATLGIAVRHVAGARDGWRLTLDALVAGEGDTLMASLAELGAVTGRMHTLLASDPRIRISHPKRRASRRPRCSPPRSMSISSGRSTIILTIPRSSR